MSNQEYMRSLSQAGSVGLDMSPGDPVQLWAYNEITRLEKEVDALREALQQTAGACQAMEDEGLLVARSWHFILEALAQTGDSDG